MTNLLEKMPWLIYKVDQDALNMVVQACSKKGLLHNAKSILEEMLQSQFHVKSETYSALLLSLGLILDTEACNILIQGHCQANDLKKVGELLGVAIRKDLEISLSSYRSLVQMMSRTGRVRVALSLKNLMLVQSTFDGLIIYNILIFYLFSAGNSFLVNKILDEMDEKKVALNEVTYNFLVYGFLQCNDLCRSVHFLTTMIAKELKPSNRSLRMVISSLCKARELRKALELSREMEVRGWIHGSVIQNAITACLLSHDGRLDKAVHLLNTMLKKHTIPLSTSYDSVISGLCTHKRLDVALDFYSEMSVLNLKPKSNTVTMLVNSFCQDGRTEEAEQLLTDMIDGGETPTREMYCSVINSYRMKSNLRKASEMMQSMQKNGYEPDFETHWSLISNLSNDKANDTDKSSKKFLSWLLSKSGFAHKK
ncbi:pentatricopeptide repeat-containing protein [Senna tora]|uniref:Pentatricopeptide repeat-containing protein n=1 Tax=Senna tora TaxID=362788 RepID=A0A834TG69_9FABA|nr:pentatricopeptide repeat-containing protein [Senna tora]